MQSFCVLMASVAGALYMIPQLCQSGKYKGISRARGQEAVLFQAILAGGLWIEERLRLKGSGRYFGWLHQKIVMLNGSRYVHST